MVDCCSKNYEGFLSLDSKYVQSETHGWTHCSEFEKFQIQREDLYSRRKDETDSL